MANVASVTTLDDVVGALDKLSLGIGATEQEVIRAIKHDNPTATSQEITNALNEGLESGMLIFPLGRGPVAILSAIDYVLAEAPDDFMPIDELVKRIVDRSPELFEQGANVEQLVANIRKMVNLGYLEANNQLSVAVSEPIFNARHGIQASESTAPTRRRAGAQTQSQTQTVSRRRSGVQTATTAAPAAAPKTKARGQSAYNIFMADEIARVKADHPGIDHKEAFKMAAANWKDSPENPKNK